MLAKDCLATHLHPILLRTARQTVNTTSENESCGVNRGASLRNIFHWLCTKANGLAILGTAQNAQGNKNHLIVSKHGALLHVDAAQSIGKIPVNVTALSADLLTIAGHKFYAPKGIGALYIRQGVRLNQLTFGADHESSLRPGTENVMHIVGIEVAAQQSMDTKKIGQQLTFLRDKLYRQLVNAISNLILNGYHEHRLPNALNVSFPGISGKELLLSAANNIAASVESACHSDSGQVSGVLATMGIGLEQANVAIRLSVGRLTTEEEIENAASSLISYYKDRIPDSAHN